MTAARGLSGRSLPFALMGASGFAGLGYQIVWTQQASTWLGHELLAVLSVVAAFFGGLSLGGLWLGPHVERSLRPRRWYAGCELVIALWGLVLLIVGPLTAAAAQRALGPEPSPVEQGLVAFVATFVLLLPATAAMGATLPAMERLAGELSRQGRSIATLYAANTLGAVLGVLAAAFWLVPAVGLLRTAAVCSGLNLLCAVAALGAFPAAVGPAQVRSADSTRARGVAARLAATGLLGIGFEVLVVRILSQVTEGTVYTFALLLAVYLTGSATGAAAYHRWLERRRDHELLGDRLLGALSAACVLSTLTLFAAGETRRAALDSLGPGFGAAIAAEAVVALLAFGPATLVMGAVFAHLSRAASAAGLSFGHALGINTLAATAAPAVFGVFLAPLLGPKLSLLAIAFGYWALARPGWSRPAAWFPAAAALGVGALAPPLRFVDVPDGGRLVSYREGAMAAVSVLEDSSGVATLHINNRQQEGSSATGHVDARQAWLPLLLHPAPRRALFLGLGTGVTAASAAAAPDLEVDVVELLPEVIAAAEHFTSDLTEGGRAARLRVIAADARRYVRALDGSYDVIVSDNFHPARSGSGALYTVEHFAAVRRRLAADGLFCQWLPLHQLDLDSLRSIVRSFTLVYPSGWALLASNSLDTPVLGLVARAGDGRFETARLRSRLLQPLPPRMGGLALEDEHAVLGSFVAGPAALARFAGDAAVNSDDRPVVAYHAPRITYAPDSRPRDRLLALLNQISIAPDELLDPAPDEPTARRLAAYWRARDRYLESGREVRPSSRVEDMLAQVQEPLLSVLVLSPDFRPAYDPLLHMASALSRSNASGARALLTQLSRIQPARREAPQLLRSLGDGPPTSDGARR